MARPAKKKSVTAQREPAAAAPAIELNQDAPPLAQTLLWAHMPILLGIVVALTPLTYSLDDIKKTMFLTFGPALMFIGLLAIVLRQAPAPPRLVRWGLLGFGAALLISTALSKFGWIGWQESLMYWSAGGFFLSAMVIGSRSRTSEIFIKFLVVQLLVTNLIGFALYDFLPNNPNVNALVSHLYSMVYGNADGPQSGLQTVLYTFSQPASMGAMQSTILNRDFYAGFLILYLPFSLLIMLDPGETRMPLLWRIVGGVTTLMSIICVVQCQSKGEYIFGAISCFGFFIVFWIVCDLPHLGGKFLSVLFACIGGLVAFLLFLLSPVLIGRLKTVGTSVNSRSIIWKGSFDIFKSHPLFGGGPGTFRIYFPQFRARNYFEHEISNVTLFSHNYFLDQLAETGILGFGFFLLFIVSLSWMALVRIFTHPNPRMRVLLLTALTALFAMFGSNLSSPNARWPIGASALWTVIGLTAGLVLQADGHARELDMERAMPGKSVRRRDAAEGYGWEATAGKFLAPGLVVIAAGLLLTGATFGSRYFRSQEHYLQGLKLMNGGNEMLESGRYGISQIQQYLGQSVADYSDAVSIDPTNYQAYYKLGSVYTTLANLERERLNQLRKNPNASPEDVQLENQQISELTRRALDTYEDLAKLWPDYAEIHYNLGLLQDRIAELIRYQKGSNLDVRFDGTPESWEQKALQHELTMHKMSKKPEVAMQLGEQYMTMGKYKDAVDVYRAACADYPKNDDLLKEYYRAAEQARDAEAACDALWKLWRAHPLEDDILDALLNTAYNADQDAVLEKALKQLESQNPVDPRIAKYRFGLAAKRSQPEQVMTQFKRYLDSGGDDASIIAQAVAMQGPLGLKGRLDDLLREHGLKVPAGIGSATTSSATNSGLTTGL